MLSSPNIWSKLVDLTSLDLYAQSIMWLQLILHRAKGLNLHVYGVVRDARGMWAFLELVVRYWKNIEVLQVRLDIDACWGTYDFTDHPAWSSISEVSPTLQHFDLRASESLLDPPTRRSTLPNYRYLLLNTQNPNVRYLFADGPSQFPFEPRAPLYQNLRVLAIAVPIDESEHFNNGTFPCEIEKIFTILESTPLLENLSIGEHVVFDVPNPRQYARHPQLQLPFLQHLDLDSDITVCLAILLHVLPSTVCSLGLRCSINPDYVSRRQIATFHDVVRVWYSRHPILGTTSRLSVRFCKFNPSLRLESPTLFRFWMFPSYQETYTIPFKFIEALVRKEFDFNTVSFMRLEMTSISDIEDISSSLFHNFLNKFCHLRSLEINWEYFYLIHAKIRAHPNASETTLPKLEELIIFDNYSVRKENPLPNASAIVEFCKSRRQMTMSTGMPSDPGMANTLLKTLNLRWVGSKFLDVFSNTISLDGLDGLEVVYGKKTGDRYPINQRAVIKLGIVVDVVDGE